MASIRFLAFKELCKRYRAVFQQVWAQRAQLDCMPREPYEAQFLPAALALQETPVSPAPRVAMWLIIGFALLAVLWSIFGKIDIVATAQGKIVPSERTKVIQPFETSTVKAIYVSDGQSVKAGQLLVELDATTSTADIKKVAADLAGAQTQAARARALLKSLAADKLAELPPLPNVPPEKVAEARQLLIGQYEEYLAKRARLQADNEKRKAEEKSTLALVQKLQKTVPIARQRAADYKKLVDQKFMSQHGYLEREQARIEQEGDLANLRSRLNELHAAQEEGQRSLEELTAETRRVTLDSLNEGEQKSAELTQELIKAKSRDELMQLKAPVNGTVQQLAIHTVGGVVTPAQALMMIVPTNEALEVEAFLENKDVGFIKEGQDAEIKIETFPYTKYGIIHGKILHVSNDAIQDEKRGLIYSTRIKMNRSTMQIENRTVNLSPGMAATIEIKTGKRRVIEYFLSPLLQYAHESLKER